MNYTNLIENWQTHLHVQYALSIKLTFTSDTGVVIDSKPHGSRTCKTSLVFVSLAVRVQAGCSAFLFYTPTKPIIQIYFKYKTILISKLISFFLF